MTAADPRDGLRAKCPRCGDNDPLATQVSVDSFRGFKYAVMTCRCGHGEVAAYYEDDRSLQDLSDKFYRIAHARPEAVDAEFLLRLRGFFQEINCDDDGEEYLNLSSDAMDEIDERLATLTPEHTP